MALWSAICTWFKNDSQTLRNKHRNHIHTKYMRHQKKTPKLIAADTVTCDYLTDDLNTISSIDDRLVADELYSSDFETLFNAVTEALSDEEKAVVWLRFSTDLSMKEIGEKVGESKQQVHLMIKRSLVLMRQHSIIKKLAGAFNET